MAMFTRFFAWLGPTSSLSQLYPPPSKFDPARDVPDLSGKVIVVTGGNTGIGYATCLVCLRKNAKVYLAARSEGRARDAIAKLQKESGKTATWLKLDLGDLASVKKAAEELKSKEEHIDVLFENAGVMTPPMDMLTAQGYDLQFGTNVLGHAYFAELLTPLLEATFDKTGSKARVVITSSYAHVLVGNSIKRGVDTDIARPGPKRDALSKNTLYGHSKMGNIVWASYMNRKYSKITTSSVHPGVIITELARYIPQFLMPILKLIGYTPDHGALTQLYAGLAPETEGAGGKYFIPFARDGTRAVDPRVHDESLQDDLAKWVAEQTKGF